MANVLRHSCRFTGDSSNKSTSRAKPAPCIREKISVDLADKAESSDRASEAGELDHYPLHQRNPWINFS
jgi:hypothetical protein